MNMKTKHEKVKKAAVLTYILWTVFTGNYAEAQTTKEDKSASLLWKVSGKSLPAPSYLFGTVHIYDTSVFRIPENIYRILDQCEALALEVDFGSINQATLMEKMLFPANEKTLDELLSPEAFAKLMQFPAAEMLGEEVVKKFKPFFITTLIADLGNPEFSVDTELYNYAVGKTKKIIGLETIEEQIGTIDKLPMEDQIEELEKSLRDSADSKEMFVKLLNAYKNQNFKFFEEMVEGDMAMDPLSSEKLLKERNINMANRIDSLLKADKKRSLFVAVGAAHINDLKKIKGLANLLKEKGYTLTPVEVKF